MCEVAASITHIVKATEHSMNDSHTVQRFRNLKVGVLKVCSLQGKRSAITL